MQWIHEQEAFADRAFVMIGECTQLWGISHADYPPGTEVTGSVLPRMMLGLTKAGSLAGVLGYTVQS